MVIYIYTDGSCWHKTREGGIGINLLIKENDKVILQQSFYKGFYDTTINRMELLAVLFALKLINNPNVQINIISDSEYAVNCTKKGINIKNGTYIEYRIDYKNKDIIDILYNQIQYFTNLNISWTRGHDGNENNNIADKLASIAYHDSKNNKIKDSGYFTKDVINDIKLFKK